MNRLDTSQLKSMRESGEQLALVNVLGPEQFQQAHIPGSSNIPLGSPDFTSRVASAAGSRECKVVVYCASTECDASPKAARKLEEAGFTKVFDYEGGVKAWREAGLPLDSFAGQG